MYLEPRFVYQPVSPWLNRLLLFFADWNLGGAFSSLPAFLLIKRDQADSLPRSERAVQCSAAQPSPASSSSK